MASSEGNDEDEETRALQRGVRLTKVLKEDFEEGCEKGTSAYVLNMGRYSAKEEQDSRSQREVIALIGTDVGATMPFRLRWRYSRRTLPGAAIIRSASCISWKMTVNEGPFRYRPRFAGIYPKELCP
jgi:hypothetical protein